MMWGSTIFLTLINVFLVNADLFVHCPRASNNRLDGNQRERKTNNRLFDSQNNARGGYNVGGEATRSADLNTIFQSVKNVRNSPGIREQAEERSGPAGKMKYYGGSILEISWTNQHQCGGKNTNCDLILQYMCSDNLRDGFLDQQIPNINSCEPSEEGSNRYCDTDRRFGMHEDTAYYTYCRNRLRNKGLFTADQNLNGKDTSIFTRQNNNGARSGYECPEERDYYPYWGPTPWVDIAVMTSDNGRCQHYKEESEKVKPRSYCKIPEKTMTRLRNNNGVGTANDKIPITKAECEAKTFDGEKGKWVKDTRPKHDAPECIFSPKSRDNHLGNGPSGFPNSFNWTVPNIPHRHCAVRLRYNISTDDYDRDIDSSLNGAGKINLGARIGADNAEAKKRGFEFKGNPKVKPLKIEGDTIGDKLALDLALNTAQYGRTFQDRSHEFEILERPQELVGKTIYNLNVQGKRGNIVQVFPAVEYDYMPNRLEVNQNDYIHIQWTGSDTNPADNAGNGKAGSDRSNMVLLKDQNYPEGTPGKAIAENLKNGHWGNSYPADLLDDSKTLLGLPLETREYLALTVFEEEKSLTTCEAQTMTISCPKAMAINITYAHYGLKNINCINHEQSIKVAQQTCGGKSDCTLSVTTRTFTDPCQGVKKCLDVTYRCIFRNRVTRLKPGEIDIGDGWSSIAGQLQQISIGDGKIVGTQKPNRIMFRVGIDSSHLYGTSLKQIPGALTSFVAGDGMLGGVISGTVYFRTGVSSSRPDGSSWQGIPGVKLKQITFGDGKIMGVGETDKVHYRTGVTEQQPFGTGWATIPGVSLKYIAVGDGKIMGVNKNDEIYFRTGVSSSNPNGKKWTKVDGSIKQIALGDGKIMGVDKDNKVYFRTGIDSSNLFGTGWKTIAGSLKQIAIGDGRIMGVNDKDEILYRTGMKNIKVPTSPGGGNLKDLDDAHPYFNLAPKKMTKLGEYKYMCTRNNDFSNRSQKGKITVKSTQNSDAIPNATEELVGMEELFEQATAAI